MITHFKSSLNQIKAEDRLVSKTEMYLKDALEKKQKSNFNRMINWRLFNMNKKIIIATSLVGLIVGISGTGVYAQYKKSVSYLSLDINPSVELGINLFDKVVEVEAYNEDGEKILDGVDVIDSDITNAVSSLISSAVDNGFIAEDGSTVISLTSETDNTDIATEIESEAEAGVNEALEENEKTAVVNKDNVALVRREEARTLGITPGKLNLINKLQAVDPSATVENYKDASVKEIMKNIKNNKNNKNNSNVSDDNTNEDNTEVIDKDDTDTNKNNDLANSKEKDKSKDKSTVEDREEAIDENNEVDTTKSVKSDNTNNSNKDNLNINKDNNNSNEDNGNEKKENITVNNKDKVSSENEGQANNKSNSKANKVDTTKPAENNNVGNGNSNNSNKNKNKGNN